MFKYKNKWIVPQREHARLAGGILSNINPLLYEGFPISIALEATTFHQQGYPEFDNIEFNQKQREESLEIFQNDISTELPLSMDALTLVMIHNLRILRETKIPADSWEGYVRYADELEQIINKRINNSDFDKIVFWKISDLIRFADRIAFLLSEGTDINRRFQISAVEYDFHLVKEQVTLIPWNFQTDGFSLILIAYEPDTYQIINKAKLVKFTFVKGFENHQTSTYI